MIISDDIICEKLNKKYDANFQSTLIRQVINVAIEKGIISKIREQYVVNKKLISSHVIPEDDFEDLWETLLTDFGKYLKGKDITMIIKDIEDNISSFIDSYDDHVIYNNIGDIEISDNVFLYHWCNYILAIQTNHPELYSFVSGICSANLMKNALFFCGVVTFGKIICMLTTTNTNQNANSQLKPP